MEGEKVEKRPTAEQAEPASLDRGTNLCVCTVTNPGEDRSEMAAVRAARLRGEGKESSEGTTGFGSESWAGVLALPLFPAGDWGLRALFLSAQPQRCQSLVLRCSAEQYLLIVRL